MSGAHHHRAKRSLGQNFLVDPNIQRKIVTALDPMPDDEILEIGPGQGALTRHLAGKVRRLVLIELDNQLAQRMTDEFATSESVEVIHGDVLQIPLEHVTTEPARLKVVGNIPYNITTPILFSLLERRPRPREIVLMVQREVADRILAPPGSKTYGALAVGVQTIADAERVLNVGPKAFRPVPDVESSVLRVRPHQPPRLSQPEEEALRRLTRAAFGHRRKQLQKILRVAYLLSPEQLTSIADTMTIDLRARPEELSPEQFVHLSRVLPPYETASSR